MLLLIFQTHRIILITTYPILQSIKNTTIKSHLKIHLTTNIKQKSIQTFLQYLYKNFIILTKQNNRNIKKITRLLQINNIIKYYTNFNKYLNTKTNQISTNNQYKYTFHNIIKFKHIKSSKIQKTIQKKTVKKNTDYPRPPNPKNKKQKTQNIHANNTTSITNNYKHITPNP